MDDEREIDLFAEKMYRYLFPRRMGTQESRPRQTKPNDVNPFTKDVGKAVLIACSMHQDKLWARFIRDISIITRDVESCICYCFRAALRLYDEADKTEDVFYTLTLVGAMILELVTFCCWNCLEDFKKYASMCWAEIFQHIFKVKFFEYGGWQTQRKRSEMFEILYDLGGYEKHFEPEGIFIDRRWLMHFDRNISKAFGSISNAPCFIVISEDDVVQPNYIGFPKSEIGCFSGNIEMGHSDDNFIQELIGPIQPPKREIELPFELDSRSTEKESDARMDKMLDLSMKSRSQIETKLAKQLDAVPKTQKVTDKDSKASSTVAASCNSDFNDSFISIIMDDNISGNVLCQVMCNDENIERLMNIRNFFEMMKNTVDMSERKPNNAKLLENALEISENTSTKNRRLYNRFSSRKCTFGEFDEGQYSKTQKLANALLLQSPPKETAENIPRPMSLMGRGKAEKMFKIDDEEDIYFEKKFAFKTTGSFGYSGAGLENKASVSHVSQEMELMGRSMDKLEINDLTRNMLPSGYHFSYTESSRTCSKDKNKTVTQKHEMEALTSFDRLTGSMAIVQYTTTQDSRDLAIIKVLKSYAESLVKVTSFDTNVKIQILKSILRVQLDWNSKIIDNIFRFSRQIINTLNQIPIHKKYAAELEDSIREYVRCQEQTTRNIENSDCDCCISEKMNIYEELVATADNLNVVEMQARVKSLCYILNTRPESEEIKTTDVSASDSSV